MPISDPFSVVVQVPGSLSEAMAELRSWLDGEKIKPSSCTTSVDAKGFAMTIGFVSIEDADRFRQRFGRSGAFADETHERANVG